MSRRRRGGLSFGKQRRRINIAVVKEVLGWTIEILLVMLLAWTFVYFAGLRTSVVGQSMLGTLNSGDEILVNRFIYKITDPKANDIIVFLPNGNEKSHYYVRRVVAVPGDKVLIQNGALYVNGVLFEDEIDVAAIEDAGIAAEEIKLGNDEYFVLGDNRNNSEDSRYANIGNVKKRIYHRKSMVSGLALERFWFSVDDFEWFNGGSYAVSMVSRAYDEGETSDAGGHKIDRSGY